MKLSILGERSSLGSAIQAVIRSRMWKRAFFGLFQRNAHDVFGDAFDLDIHLHGSDTFTGTGALEVHVAQMIFQAHDVCENYVFFAFHYEAVRDAGYRALIGTPAAIMARHPLQIEAIEDEPFDSEYRQQCEGYKGNVRNLATRLSRLVLPDFRDRVRACQWGPYGLLRQR